MDNVLYIPFQSINRLGELSKDPSQIEFMDSFITDVLVPGLRHYMKQREPILQVYAINVDEHPTTVDVHLQLQDKKGNPHQPWVFSFTCDPDKDQTTFTGATSPFPSESFFWDCEHFDKEEIVKACEAWSETFWPDFDASFEYGYVENLLWDWDELFDQMFSDGQRQQWIVQPREEVTTEAEKELENLGSVVVTEKEVLITTSKSDQLITTLAKDWPELSLMPADSSGYEQ